MAFAVLILILLLRPDGLLGKRRRRRSDAGPLRSMALLAALVVIGVVSALTSGVNPYFLDVAVSCGINITLAVSLNLINGYTGQFSLGHAGFMAVGAYVSRGADHHFRRRTAAAGGRAGLAAVPGRAGRRRPGGRRGRPDRRACPRCG